MDPFGEETESTDDDLYEAAVWLLDHLGISSESTHADEDDETRTFDG